MSLLHCSIRLFTPSRGAAVVSAGRRWEEGRSRIAPARLGIGGILLLLFIAAGCATELNDDLVPRVDAPVVSNRIDAEADAVIVDVRPAEAFERGHIPGARNLRLSDTTRQDLVASLRGERVIVYGQNPGSASAMAMTKRLISQGLNASLFEDGFDAWRAGGLPVERGGGP